MSVKEKMTTIADAIRTKTGKSEPLTLEGMAQGVERVFAAGEQSEYDRFWDAYQQNGNRTAYRDGFGGKGWTENTFYPKYDIVPSSSSAANLFFDADFGGDLAQRLSEQGVVLDTSKATILEQMFSNNARLTRVGVIDISNAGTRTSGLFSFCAKLVTIDKLVVAANNAFVSIFQNCDALENLTVEGAIGVSGLNVQWSTKLSKVSIISVVNALSETTSGLSVTLSKIAVNNVFTTAEWATLAGTKSNWTINLV